MDRVNWPRVFLCGLVAGLVWTILSVILLTLVGGDILAAAPNGGLPSSGGVHVLLLGANFAAGIWAMWLYAAIRPRYGPGPKSALLVGLAWWVIVSMQSGK